MSKKSKKRRTEVETVEVPENATSIETPAEASIDPNICSTPECEGIPALNHIGRPLCQACWQKYCDETSDAPATEPPPSVPAPEPAAKSKRTKKAPPEPKPKKLSALDAAAQVLAEAGVPMQCNQIVMAMAERGLWESPGGTTPAATLYAAIIREIANKGPASRFVKCDRGTFGHAPMTEAVAS